MDVGAFAQENRRWLLGCAAGLVAFFVGQGIVGSIWNPDRARSDARSAANVGSVYDATALQNAVREQQELQAARARLQQELEFVPAEAFLLEGKSLSPDEYLGKIGRERKLQILRAADERGVAVTDRDLVWPPAPQGVDEIRSVLFGIELVDAVAERLFQAHDAVRQQDATATGLVSMQLRADGKRGQRAPQRGKPGDADLRELLDQERVQFDFKADEATATAFLESLRRPQRTLVLEPGLKFAHSGRRGDPVQITGSVAGIAFKAKKD